MSRYSVTKLAKLAGVSVRTLHLYDQLGLLKPSTQVQVVWGEGIVTLAADSLL